MKIFLAIVCGTLMVATDIFALDSLPIGTEQRVRDSYFNNGVASRVNQFSIDITKLGNPGGLVYVDDVTYDTLSNPPTTEAELITLIEERLWQGIQPATSYPEGTEFQFVLFCFSQSGYNLASFRSPVFSLSKADGEWVFPSVSTNVMPRLTDGVEIIGPTANGLWAQIKTNDNQGHSVTYDSRQSTGLPLCTISGSRSIFVRSDLVTNSLTGEFIVGYTPTGGSEIRERFDLATGAKLRAPLQTKIGVTNGLPTITAIGEPTASVVLEYTDSLTGSWTQITNLSLGESGSANYTCEPTSSSLRRFFRARYLP